MKKQYYNKKEENASTEVFVGEVKHAMRLVEKVAHRQFTEKYSWLVSKELDGCYDNFNSNQNFFREVCEGKCQRNDERCGKFAEKKQKATQLQQHQQMLMALESLCDNLTVDEGLLVIRIFHSKVQAWQNKVLKSNPKRLSSSNIQSDESSSYEEEESTLGDVTNPRKSMKFYELFNVNSIPDVPLNDNAFGSPSNVINSARHIVAHVISMRRTKEKMVKGCNRVCSMEKCEDNESKALTLWKESVRMVRRWKKKGFPKQESLDMELL